MKRIALALLLLAIATVTAHADNIPPIPRPIPYNSPRPITGKGLYFVGLVTNDGDTHGPQCVPTAVTLSGLSAEVDSIAARDIVLLVLIAATVLLVRWAWMEGKRGK